MFCGKCGATLPEGSAFCTNCGNVFEQQTNNNFYAGQGVNGFGSNDFNNNAVQKPAKSKIFIENVKNLVNDKNNKNILLIGAAAVVVIIILLIILLSGGPKKVAKKSFKAQNVSFNASSYVETLSDSSIAVYEQQYEVESKKDVKEELKDRFADKKAENEEKISIKHLYAQKATKDEVEELNDLLNTAEDGLDDVDFKEIKKAYVVYVFYVSDDDGEKSSELKSVVVVKEGLSWKVLDSSLF